MGAAMAFQVGLAVAARLRARCAPRAPLRALLLGPLALLALLLAAPLAAGCDVILHCSGLDAWGKVLRDPDMVLREMNEIVDACPELSGDALRRAQAADASVKPPKPFDKTGGRERLNELLARGTPGTV